MADNGRRRGVMSFGDLSVRMPTDHFLLPVISSTFLTSRVRIVVLGLGSKSGLTVAQMALTSLNHYHTYRSTLLHSMP